MLPDVFIGRVFVFFPDFIFVTLILILQSFVVIVPSSISEDDITHNMSANSIPPPALQTTKALSFERTETESSVSLASDSLSLDSTVTLGLGSTTSKMGQQYHQTSYRAY